MTEKQLRDALRDAYLINFPDDLFHFWEFAQSFGADNPLQTFWSPMGISLEGPFKVLAGETQSQPSGDWYLDNRYYDDPPEFFLVFSGDTDGLHWGYWFDDPDNSPACCVADYFSRDSYDITEDGETLFEAFRFHLEGCHESTLEYLEEDQTTAEDLAAYEADLETYALHRTRLMRYATGGRSEIGEEYRDKYAGISDRVIVADTLEGMGIVVPDRFYRPLSINGEELRKLAIQDANLSALLAEAQRALAEGFPGTALELGRNLWVGNERQKQHSYHLLSSAYAALNRPTLFTLLQRIESVRKK